MSRDSGRRSTFIHSFIHFGHFNSVPSSPLLLRGAPDHYSTNTVSEFHAEAPQEPVSKGLAQGLYVAARAHDQSVDLTNAPPRPTWFYNTHCVIDLTHAPPRPTWFYRPNTHFVV